MRKIIMMTAIAMLTVFSAGCATLFDSKRGPKPTAHVDEERLYGEIGRLKMELDWLKNKSGL